MDVKRGKKRKLTRSQKSDYNNKMDRCDFCKKWSNKEMVQCDICKNWFHFRCVGVGRDVENEDWSCERCNERWSDSAVAPSAAMRRHAECLKPKPVNNYTKLPVAVKSVSRPVVSGIPAGRSNEPPAARSNGPIAEQFSQPPAGRSDIERRVDDARFNEPPSVRSMDNVQSNEPSAGRSRDIERRVDDEPLAGQSYEPPAGRSPDIERRVDDVSREVCKLKRVVAADQAGIRRIVELFTQTHVAGPQAALGVKPEYNKTLPCQTLQQLDILLTEVEIKSNYNQLNQYVKSIGGTNQDNAIKRALDTIMDKRVQKQLSWTGLRTRKPGFAVKYKLLVELIHEVMQENYRDYKRIDGERKLGALLRSA